MTAQTIEWLIIDGYSLLYRDHQTRATLGRNLQLARHTLIRSIERGAGSIAKKVTVVFDGRGEQISQDDLPCPIEILFAPGHLTADSVIERMVASAPNAASIMVVTSDRHERETVMAAGATSMSCGSFLEMCAREDARLQRPSPGRKKLKPTIGDHFPDKSS